MKLLHTLSILFFLSVFVYSCHNGSAISGSKNETKLLENVGYPQGILHGGKYYFTFQSIGGDSFVLIGWKTCQRPVDAPFGMPNATQ